MPPANTRADTFRIETAKLGSASGDGSDFRNDQRLRAQASVQVKCPLATRRQRCAKRVKKCDEAISGHHRRHGILGWSTTLVWNDEQVSKAGTPYT
jgi:hypothetical protein